MDEYKKYYETVHKNICPQLFDENTRIPIRLHDSYRLCMTLHDEMLMFLRNATKNKSFIIQIPLDNDLKLKLEKSDSHILDWMKENNLDSERSITISLTVLRAVMEDMLSYIFESLEMARKGKMSLAFSLIRKPIQENLFIIEEIILSPDDFVTKYEKEDKSSLNGPTFGNGSPEEKEKSHVERIGKILDDVSGEKYFNANYIYQLRYNKNSNDSFDSICNKSIHLLTTRPSIRTEYLNLNMVFSNISAIETQFDFFFSRSIYIISYIYHLVSFIENNIYPATNESKIRTNKIIEALTAMWFIQLPTEYTSTEIYNFCLSKTESLKNDISYKECVEIINNQISQKL